MKRRAYLVTYAILVVGLFGRAQFIRLGPEKFVTITIPHTPSLGVAVKKIAFGPVAGECASDLADRMMQTFVSNNVEVIDRQHLDQIIAEHNFNQSIYSDPQSAAALGKILGPTALIFLRVSRCSTERTPLFDPARYNNPPVWTSRTRVSVSGSIQTVDLTTGRVLSAQTVEANRQKENLSNTGQPEFPPDDVVKDMAFGAVVEQAQHMFFPWREGTRVVFYDDKDCGLRDAYGLFSRGDIDGALKLIETNLEGCKSEGKKEKAIARAYYDAGLLSCLKGDYDHAKGPFTQAMQTKGAESVATASAACARAQAGAEEVAAYKLRVVTVAVQPPNPPGAPSVLAPSPSQHLQSPPLPNPTPPSAPAAATSPSLSVEERLKKLDDLRKKGLINQKDYDAKKAEILKDL